jgi:hypothetical protein
MKTETRCSRFGPAKPILRQYEIVNKSNWESWVPPEIVDSQDSYQSTQLVRELFVMEDCNTD